MALSPGTRVGPYEILGPIGAGGMGEVFRATDTQLGREVAIKVLRAEVAGDPERLARFEREARLLASLNHPNIAQVYGFESGTLPDGSAVHFLAMELVEGEDLAERLKRGAIQVDESVEIAKQIAEALEEAHEKGIVHRDLKPANVKVTPDGKVKVLDFGLAKAYAGETASGSSADLSQSPTLAHTGTQAGVILGTAAYMSPEQARGKTVDKRADIWSFGVVLFEMLTGKRLFQGETVSDTLAAVLKTDPEWTLLPAGMPSSANRLLHRCLERDPRKRLRDIGEARLALDETEPAVGATELRPAAPRRSLLSRVWPVAAAVVVTAVVALGGKASTGVSLDAARFVPFAVDADVQSMPAWSPDGQSLAYSGGVAGYYQIFTRQLSQSTPVQLTNLDADCLYPQWDPTGTRVFFQRASGNQSALVGQTWGEVWVVSAAGGYPERVSESVAAFTVAPVGEAILYLKPSGRAAEGAFELWSHDLKSGADRLLQALPDRWTGFPPTSGALRFSPDGARLALLSSDENEILLLPNPLITPGGGPRRVRLAAPEGGTVSLSGFSWLPDSRQFVADLRDPRGGDQSIWLGDIERGTVTRVTASVQWESAPAVAPDGSRIAFSATPLDWDILEVDLRSGQSRPLVASSRYDGWGEWMPDGSGILYSTLRTGRFEIWAESLRDHATRAIVTPDAFPGGPSFFLVQSAVSPDARSVAYVRSALNEQRIYVSAIAGSRPVQLTADTHRDLENSPVWSPDGRWILFRRGEHLMKALASGGTSGTVVAQDQAQGNEGQRPRWLPDGRSAIYHSVDGLKQVPTDGGGPARLVTREVPVLWDITSDGRLLYAIIERERRAIDLSTIDIATGVVRTLKSLGRRPLSPDYNGYSDTLRAMRVSPDGARLMYAFLNPNADIWILEGFTPPSRPWWRFW